MANIKLNNLLAENMRRFGTKNLNEQRQDKEKTKLGSVHMYDEQSAIILGKRVNVYDTGPQAFSAQEALDELQIQNSRLFTKDEIQNYIENYRGSYNDRTWIQDPTNDNNPMLWDLKTNTEAPRGQRATRLLTIGNDTDTAQF